ncbi:protoporphyrinogen oxidase [bacterium]|nr:protoporphyrinogen oxidase [bacterium]
MQPTPERAPRRIAVIGGGVAGLATALDLLDRADASGAAIAVTVFERGPAPGGNLQTIREDGWQLEWGPNGFLDNEPATLRLVARLGLDDDLVRSSDAARRRFLLVDGRLQEIPTSPGAFLGSRLLPLGGKLRMARELFVPPRRDLGRAAVDPATDETIAEFGRRRLGPAFTEIMLDPMVKGIFGGEAEELSLAAAFPRMVELERDHGGLFRAMIALGRQRKREKKSATDAGPSGTLHSFRGGMGQLVGTLARTLADDPRAAVLTDADVSSLTRDGDGWTVHVGGAAQGPFAAVVEASPAHAAARHLRAVDERLTEVLDRIPYAPMAVIALGFRRENVGHDLDGFGLLVPGRENRDLLGALWTSSIFPGRAPAGHVLLRCMAGGAGNPGVMELDDAAMTDLILSELRPLLHLKGAPAMVRVIRHERAIAQYTRGHLARLARLDELAAGQPGLHLTGSSYRGVSVNYCLKEAELAADRVLAALARPDAAAAEVV